MDWKNLLLAILGVVLGPLYTYVTGQIPTFPIDPANFDATVLWIVGYLIGGWNVNSLRVGWQLSRKGSAVIADQQITRK